MKKLFIIEMAIFSILFCGVSIHKQVKINASDEIFHTQLLKNKIDEYRDKENIKPIETTHSVRYHLNDGKLTDSVEFTLSYENMETLKLPEAKKDGYTFVGWYLDEEFTEKASIDKYYFENLDLYAKFTKKPSVDTSKLGNYYVLCGNWGTPLIFASSKTTSEVQSIVDGYGAFTDIFGNLQYIAEHTRQGGWNFEANNELIIYNNGVSTKYYKQLTKYQTIDVYYSVSSYALNDGSDIRDYQQYDIVTQTCVGNVGDQAFSFWSKNQFT